MLGRKAKLLSPSNVDDLLAFASTTRYPVRNRAIVLLSVKAGLRAGEIANLTWDMVLEPAGELGTVLELCDGAAKKRSGRQIPIHPDLRVCLAALQPLTSGTGPVIASERGGSMAPASIVSWFGESVCSGRPHRLLVPFRTAHIHHASRPGRSPGRRVAAGRAAAGWAPVAANHRAVHRR